MTPRLSAIMMAPTIPQPCRALFAAESQTSEINFFAAPAETSSPRQLPPDQRDLASYRALVGRVLVVARLEPLEHFAHQLALGRRQPVGIDSASDRHKEPIPIVSWWRAGAGGPAAAGSICRSGVTGGFSIEQIMLPRKAFDLYPGDQDIGRNDHEPFGRFADPLPLGLAVQADASDADPLQSSSIGPKQRQHVGAGDFGEIAQDPRRRRLDRRSRDRQREQAFAGPADDIDRQDRPAGRDIAQGVEWERRPGHLGTSTQIPKTQ